MSSNATPKNDNPPPAEAILLVYLVLGSIVAFGFGRDPAFGFPKHVHKEIAPNLVVLAGFLVSYNLYDVMGVALAKKKTNYVCNGLYKDMEAKMPEEVFLAMRAQTNQVEQMPAFIVGSLSCALFVDGTVAATMSLIWVIFRGFYASTYRSSVGVPFDKKGLDRFTVPAYFVSNAMLISAAIQALRSLFV